MVNYSTKDAREHFAELINRVAFTKDRVSLMRHGKIVAYVVPVEDMEAIEAKEDAKDIADAKKILADIKKGKETTRSWESIKKELKL